MRVRAVRARRRISASSSPVSRRSRLMYPLRCPDASVLISFRMRVFISSVALLVKVTARIAL